ncbi:Phospholipase C (modular protein) [Candidatus Sulfotelmatobacter kueseliae]|uniref:Phospholipase C (Modular protein) n=1 Tax=Candidatus Sulfotelmatobacter kueseliae TaxID=2042962 RepID=A0A2U3KMA1_9BACT|nr:Phospholipase C (modular protein) [Candidatus Sulfotelmatobacter kueseliae]
MQVDRCKGLLAGLAICLASLAATTLFAQEKPTAHQQAVSKYLIRPENEPTLTTTDLVNELRKKVQYVFVFYQENRSFDSVLGTFPNAEGLFTNPPAQTPGFVQQLINTDGTTTTIRPFRMGPKEFAADTDDVGHDHGALINKMDIQGTPPKPLMDMYALTEENNNTSGAFPNLAAKQAGELTMAYMDCDTLPFLWRYADRFVLFDHIFQLMIGPSTPGNLSIIGAQTGVTQWALHPDEAGNVPVLGDPNPFWGSSLDPTPLAEQMPYNPGDLPDNSPSINLSYATLPLSLLGKDAKKALKADRDPVGDLDDVQNDIEFLAAHGKDRVAFGWYQEGFDKEPTDSSTSGPEGTHSSYSTHHDAPQYFGYLSNNLTLRNDYFHGLQDFWDALDKKTLPSQGGVFFIKGGTGPNNLNLTPADPASAVQSNFGGDDEHPGYSDAQISEATVAEGINKIAKSPYWARSAIIITYDDSEGDYDHVIPPLLVTGPDGSWISDGPRVPLVLISPYARTQYVAKAHGNHASVLKFVETVFDLPPLATLPDEKAARQEGKLEFGQTQLGPQDAITPHVTDLLDAFSPSRLTGKALPLPPQYVEISESLIKTLPQTTGYGCADLGITTTDRAKGIVNPIPPDFNPRPFTTPTPPDFIFSATPSSHTVNAGANTTYTANVAPFNGFTGTVSLVVSGLPTGATASFNPASISGGSGSSILIVSTTASTPLATSTLTITGTSGSLIHTATVTLVVQSAKTADFTLSATPGSQTVSPGGNTAYTASVSPLNGFTAAVSLGVSGLPTGATASFSPTSISGGSGSSTLTVSTTTSTRAGTFTLVITGSSGSVSHAATVSLVVPLPAGSVQTVQHNSGFNGNAASVAVAFTSNVTSGDLVLVAESTYAGQTLQAPTDSQGNTFTQLVTANSAGNSVAGIYVGTANSTGADTVTCNINSANNIHCHIYELSGATALVDAQGTSVQTGTALSVSTATATTSANDYIFAYFSGDNSKASFTAGSGFADTETTDDPSNDCAFSEDELVTTMAIQTATATASTSDTFVELIVALKPKPSTAAQAVQHNSGFGYGTSVPIAFANNVTSGNLVLVAESAYYTHPLAAPTDSQGNTFTQLVTANSTGNAAAAIYVAVAASSGADTVNCNIGTAGNMHCHIYEVSGATAVVDTTGTVVQTGTALSVSTSAATTNANDYIFAYFSGANSEATFTAGSGFADTETTDSPSDDCGFSEDELANTAAIQTATATASTSDTFVNLIVALK